jgi:hypothetical protein
MTDSNQVKGNPSDEPRRNHVFFRYGLLLFCFLIVAFIFGIALLNPGLMTNPGPILATVTSERLKLSPTPFALADASPAASGTAQQSRLQTPNNYLDLMSSDPATLPPDEQPIATALNKILYGMKDADTEQRNAEKDFQAQALNPIQAPKDKQLLEGAKTYATNLKTVSEKRAAYYKAIGDSLGSDLKAAGTPDAMVKEVTTLFVERSGVESGIAHSDGAAKVAADIVAIIDQLQQNRSKWKASAEGKMSFSDRETMNKFNSLIQTLNTDLHAVQPPIGSV